MNANGKVQVTGVKKALQESAEYPIQFGFAVQGLLPQSIVPQGRNPEDVCNSSSDESLDDLFLGAQQCSWRKLLKQG